MLNIIQEGGILIDYLSKEDLPEFLQGLVDIMGIEAFINLIKEYGGSSLYIPNENSVLKPIRNRLIKKHFNGNNYKELAKEFKISEMQVRNIINNLYQKKMVLLQLPSEASAIPFLHKYKFNKDTIQDINIFIV